MAFNSIYFLVFAIVFFSGWWYFKKKNNSRWIYLVVASFIFYGWWDWRFLFLLAGSGMLDFACGIWMEKYHSKRSYFLALSLLGNVGALAFFKYSSFFAEILDHSFSALHLDWHLTPKTTGILLPMGISFYTFQSLSYSIDVYRGRLKATKNVFHFFSFLAMFPQLVAGPIIRAKDLLNQLTVNRRVSDAQLWHGIKLIVYGLFQKMVIADHLSFLVEAAYGGKLDLWGFAAGNYYALAFVAFGFQIYCDFSGYSLIARGLAKLMGYHFKMNFNHPYLAKSFRSFWQRWHISLSTWFKDYVYIPLGGSHKGIIVGSVAVAVTFILSGLWHGANYTFLVWGAIHAFLLLSERAYIKLLPSLIKLLVYPLIVFVLVQLSWVYFRSESIAQAHQMFEHLLSISSFESNFKLKFVNPLTFLTIAILIELTYFVGKKFPMLFSNYRKYHFDVLSAVGALLLILFFRGEATQFIYFQF